MNATPVIAEQSASRTTPIADDSATSDAQREQREKNKRSFRAKYDAMLYIVEFLASFHLLHIRNPGQAKKLEDVKSLVSQTRNGLSVRH